MVTEAHAAHPAEVPRLNLPFTDFRRVHLDVPSRIHEGLDKVAHDLVGLAGRLSGRRRRFERLTRSVVDRAEQLRRLPDAALRRLVADLGAAFRRQSHRDAPPVVEALAAMVEVACRTLGFVAHPCQVTGALALHEGCLIEMATGEGKSLTACLVAPLAAWTGKPCHIITVNDYLAGRDAQEMRAHYDFCNVSVGCVIDQMESDQRRLEYGRGVVYTTSQQILADFLRDRLRMGSLQHPGRRLIRGLLGRRQADREELVMRGLDFALVDEADSVLIDEAVTPLIISAPSENRPLVEATNHALEMSSTLERGKDYTMDERYREVRLTDSGRQRIDGASGAAGGIWQGSPRRTELVVQALVARELYRRDKHYVIHEDKIVIVDEFTGRLMPDRHWSHGLHQAVQAKEQVEVTSPTETLARLSFQKFFRLFRRLCGMSGTISETMPELWHIYELPVVEIPTHRPCLRKELPDAVHPDARRKTGAIVEEVLRLHRMGRPVLVGTRSVQASEELARLLTERSVSLNVLNATRHKEEARIVAEAGQPGRITIATNMAGRGTDIKLGEGVPEMGGLHVIATERNESRRIDRQLFGRCARQGDPGSCQAFLSPDDELLRRFLPGAVRQGLQWAIAAGLPGSRLMAERAIARAQKGAQTMAFGQRESVLKVDEWLEESLSFAGRGQGV